MEHIYKYRHLYGLDQGNYYSNTQNRYHIDIVYANPQAYYMEHGNKEIKDPKVFYPIWGILWIIRKARECTAFMWRISSQFVIDLYADIRAGTLGIPNLLYRFISIPRYLWNYHVGLFYEIINFRIQYPSKRFIKTFFQLPLRQFKEDWKKEKHIMKIMFLIALPLSMYILLRRHFYIKHNMKEEISVKDKVVLITGANSGIGEVLVYELMKRGAHVIMVASDIEKITRTAHNVYRYMALIDKWDTIDWTLEEEQEKNKDESFEEKIHKPNASSYIDPMPHKYGSGIPEYINRLWIPMDFGDIKSIWRGVYQIFDVFNTVDIIINNAAVCVPTEESIGKTYDGFEVHFGVNYLGHYILTNAILSYLPLPVTTPVKIVTVVCPTAFSSGRFTLEDLYKLEEEFDGTKLSNPYATSKLLQYIFHLELTNRLKEAGGDLFRTYAVSPPRCETNLNRFSKKSRFEEPFFPKPAEAGCQPILYCLLNPSCDNETGKYYESCGRVSAPYPCGCKDKYSDKIGTSLWNLTRNHSTRLMEKARKDDDCYFMQSTFYGEVRFKGDEFPRLDRQPYLPEWKRELAKPHMDLYKPRYLEKDAMKLAKENYKENQLMDWWIKLYGAKDYKENYDYIEQSKKAPFDPFFDTEPSINPSNGWMYNLT